MQGPGREVGASPQGRATAGGRASKAGRASPGAEAGRAEAGAARSATQCLRCGACCVAPDIAALDKPAGVRCPHLGADLLCATYGQRPAVCRAHRPDEICLQVAAPPLEERCARYLALFGLTAEAERNARLGITSMRRARALPERPDDPR